MQSLPTYSLPLNAAFPSPSRIVLFFFCVLCIIRSINADILWEECDFEVDPNQRPGLDTGDFYNLCLQSHAFESQSYSWKFTKATIQSTSFDECVFTNRANAPNNFTGASWSNVVFNSCSFGSFDPFGPDIVFDETSLTNVVFSKCTFDHSVNILFSKFSMTNVTFDECTFRGNVRFELGEMTDVKIVNSRARRMDEVDLVSGFGDSVTFRQVTMNGVSILGSEFVNPVRFEGVDGAFVSVNKSTFYDFECDSGDRFISTDGEDNDDDGDNISILRSSFNDSILYDLKFYGNVRCSSTMWRQPHIVNITFFNDADMSQSTYTDFEIETIHQEQLRPHEEVCNSLDFSNSTLQRGSIANFSIDCLADFANTVFEKVRVKNLFVGRPVFENAVFKGQEYIDGICCSVACKNIQCLCNVTHPSGNCPSGDRSVNVSKDALPKKGGAACFPEDAQITKHDGSVIRMSELERRDFIHSGEDDGIASEIFFFSHRDRHSIHEYMHIIFDNGGSIKISEGHYLYVNGLLQVARIVQVGDMLRSGADSGDRVKVKAVKKVHLRGAYAPTSMTGKLVVDGIVVSSFTEAVHPKWAERLLWPLKMAHRMKMDMVVDAFQSLFEKSSLEHVGAFLHIPRGQEAI